MPRGPSTSSRSTEASASSANPEPRAHAQAGQYDRPHRCPCSAGARCSSVIRPSTSTAPLSVVAAWGRTYPLPRSRAIGDSQAGMTSSAGAPWPNESRQRSACPPASTSPVQPDAVSSAAPNKSPVRLIVASSTRFRTTYVRAGALRSNQLPQREESHAPPESTLTPYRSHRPWPAFASLAETNHASWNPPLETRGHRGELSESASTRHRYACAKTPSSERAEAPSRA